MKKNKIGKIIFQTMLCFMLSLSTIIFAENNNEENHNDEHAKIFKLDEEKSSIKDDVIDIPIDCNMKLVFTKNISYGEEIIELNKSCVSIIDEDENIIDIEIDIKDSSLAENEEYKNIIFIKPIKSLENNKKYTIIIGENLKTHEEYLEKHLPLNLNFTTIEKEEPEIPEDENITDKDTLIIKIKEALLLKYNIELEEVEKNIVIIVIRNKEGNIIDKSTYLGTIEEVKAIIKKIEEEINKPQIPDPKPDPKPETNPKPDKPKPNPNPDEIPDPESDEEDGNDNWENEQDNDKSESDLSEDRQDDKQEESNNYGFGNNLGVAFALCVFIGISMYMIYFS